MNSNGSTMARKSWFSLVKKFFISDTYVNQYKKQRRKRWFLGRFKIKRLPSISDASPSIDTKVSEAEEEQSKQKSDVAISKVAAEVLDQPSSTPQYAYQSEDETQELSSINFQYNAPPSTPQWGREIQKFAATKIQTAFRGFLARKALWALKGIVQLQAIIRGILVRRQAMTTLNRLQSIVNIQSKICAKRSQMVDSTYAQGNKELMEFEGRDNKIDLNSQRRWDDSLLTKEEEHALCSSKRMAAIKRERIKEYSFSNRRSAELEQSKTDGRWRYWLEQWVDTRLNKREDLQNLVSVFSTRERIRDDESGLKQVKPRNLNKHCHNQESELTKVTSFHHRKQHSVSDQYSTREGGSPIVPTYMAATESAKAKARSMSSPRLRPMSFDSQSETYSPYKHKLSPISSINSEVTTISMLTNPRSGFSQRSPGFKGPVKSNRSSKHLSID